MDAMTAQQIEYSTAVAGNADRWVPACGGMETPMTCEGRRLLYCFNPRRHEHRYLDLDADLILEDADLPPRLRGVA